MTLEDWSNRPAADPGDDFEDYCWALLRRRYDPQDLVYIPATMGGDHGIEGYSRDGIAYQCYADRDSLSLRHRTDKQKTKLYDDTMKLKKYSKELKSILDGTIICNYFLMVPEYHAAELVAYANSRAEVVRSWSLDFISDDFRVFIKTPQDYPVELNAALAGGAMKAVVPDLVVDASQVPIFSTEKPELVSVLERKLSVLDGLVESVEGLRDRFIRSFLTKEQIMISLKEWPETWEAVERKSRVYQENLEYDNDFNMDDPRERMAKLVKEYSNILVESVPSIREEEANRISYGQTAEWLMRCPLRLRKLSG